MKVMGLIGIGAAVISQPELWPAAVGVAGKLVRPLLIEQLMVIRT